VLADGRRHIAWYCSPIAYRNNRAAKFSLVEPVLAKHQRSPVELPLELMGKPAALARHLATRSTSVDAIFCQNDLEAVGLMVALQRVGIRCPEDILVVGCDGNYVVEGLWTISLDIAAMVRTAVDLLVKRIAGESPVPERLVMKARLVTGKPSNA
jgi:DNA-binding LacI/PurR family transcriptional regulator